LLGVGNCCSSNTFDESTPCLVIGNGPSYEQTGPGAYDGIFHDHGEPVNQHYITNDAVIFAGNMGVTESGSGMTQYYWEAYHLMGDPSVMTYFGVPSVNDVEHNETVMMTAPSFTDMSMKPEWWKFS